ncbi:MAG: sigma-54 dependent transcriptional regulator [Gammaproteobacteria bacterium]|jgi:DNA-binding NtrC family response regulator|nr:sigma-54 dependent transcriptional regulator [Gammaproteobacteria bacterium]
MTSHNLKVLIIDDDREVRRSLGYLFTCSGWQVVELANAKDIQKNLKQHQPNVVISDVRMPGDNGLDAFAVAREGLYCPEFIFISAHADVDMAVGAMTLGAYSFFEKPYDPKRLLLTARHAAEQDVLKKQNQLLLHQINHLSGLDQMLIGNNAELVQVRQLIHQFAPVNAPVMILGETGTGKELAAKAIHSLSNRADKAFVTVNCAMLDTQHFASMMFGSSTQAGYIEKAEGGTLFLDELSAVANEQQAQLLHLIDHGEYQQVGSIDLRQADVRIVSATNGQLTRLVEQGKLRQDLIYRLDGLSLHMPALRDHGDDIHLLFNHYSMQFGRVHDITPAQLTAADITTLMTHKWPGNVRELMHLAERHILRSRVQPCSVADAMTGQDAGTTANQCLRPAVAAFERALISKVLIEHEGRMDEVADCLGIGRRTLNEKMVKLGLDRSSLL